MRNRSTIDNDEWVRYMCNMSQTPRRTCILFRLIGIVYKYAGKRRKTDILAASIDFVDTH